MWTRECYQCGGEFQSLWTFDENENVCCGKCLNEWAETKDGRHSIREEIRLTVAEHLDSFYLAQLDAILETERDYALLRRHVAAIESVLRPR